MKNEAKYQKRRSRRRKGSRGRELFIGFTSFLLVLVLIAGIAVAGIWGYRYFQGNKTTGIPLESSRPVETETMRAD